MRGESGGDPGDREGDRWGVGHSSRSSWDLEPRAYPRDALAQARGTSEAEGHDGRSRDAGAVSGYAGGMRYAMLLLGIVCLVSFGCSAPEGPTELEVPAGRYVATFDAARKVL